LAMMGKITDEIRAPLYAMAGANARRCARFSLTSNSSDGEVMAEAVRIAVLGAAGKMGGAIVRAMAETPTAAFVVAVERPDFSSLGADASRLAGLPESGVRVQADRPGRGAADVWIDFSSPGAALANASAAAQAGAAIRDRHHRAFHPGQRRDCLGSEESPHRAGAQHVSGRERDAALGWQTRLAFWVLATTLKIVETHHRAKRDAPSGTALRLARPWLRPRAVISARAHATSDMATSGAHRRRDRHPDLARR